jgi:hypothetical protein
MPAEYDTNRMTPRQRRDLNRSKLLHDLAIPFLIVGMAASLIAVGCNDNGYRNRHRQEQRSSSRWHPPMDDPNQPKPRQPDRPRRGDGNGSQIYNGFTNSTTGSSSGLFHP